MQDKKITEPTEYHSSFRTTGRLWLPDGMSEISGICLDTGAEGCQNTISPSAVRLAGMRSRKIPPKRVRGVNNIWVVYTQAVTFELTLANATRTVHAVVDQEDSSYSILLGMPGLHAFGISIHCETSPVMATMHHNSNQHETFTNLVSDTPYSSPKTVFYHRDDLLQFIPKLLDDPNFAQDTLPDAAVETPAALRSKDWKRVLRLAKLPYRRSALLQYCALWAESGRSLSIKEISKLIDLTCQHWDALDAMRRKHWSDGRDSTFPAIEETFIARLKIICGGKDATETLP